ncbi:MAG: hypothetical protein DDT28_01130 [Dehalococcoidia bacterium]|nr:hypothetical protein [Chloroflexota bacterium]
MHQKERVIRHGETGYVVAGNAPQILADTIARLFSSQNNGIRPAGYIRGSVARFNWANIADFSTIVADVPFRGARQIREYMTT